jgi:rfaE bifunctional protein nucleotidyltransferase chain/domain
VCSVGIFDLIRPNHLSFLESARKEGDLLTVGIFSDEFVKKQKGKDRPINNEIDRATVLSKLSFCDLVVVVPFNQERKFLEDSLGMVYVKGGNLTEEEVYQKEDFLKNFSIKVKILKKFEGFSTQELIDKLKNKRKK